MADYNAGTIRATVDANTRPYSAAMARIKAETTATTRSIERDTGRASAGMDGLSGNAKILSSRFFDLGAAITGIGIPAIISLVQPAAAALNALGGGAVIATKSITDMSGAIAGVPIALSAMAQGMGAAKFATMGLSDAVSAYASGDNEAIKEALKGTSTEAAEFAKNLVSMQPAIERIRDAAAGELFPGLTAGLESAARNLPQLKASMAGTAAVMGDLADQAGQLIGSAGFGERFGEITRNNAGLLEAAGGAGINLADALSRILVEAKPVVTYMTDAADAIGSFALNSVKAGQASGGLRNYFQSSVDAFDDWVEIAKSAGSVLRDIFEGASGPANAFRDWLVDTTNQWEQWTESAKGTREIGEFFDRIQPSLIAAGALFADLAKAIFDLGNTDAAQEGFVAFANALRTDLLPAITELVKGVGPELATNLVDLATAIAKILSVAEFSPILLMVGAFARLASALADLISMVPGASAVLGVLSAYFVATRIMNVSKFSAALAGLGGAGGKLQTALSPVGAALGNMVDQMKIAEPAATSASRSMASMMATQQKMPGITLATTGATTKLTAANRLLATSSNAVGGAMSKLAAAGPAVAAMVGVIVVDALINANNAGKDFLETWQGFEEQMGTGEFEAAQQALKDVREEIAKNDAAMKDSSENAGSLFNSGLQNFMNFKDAIENKGFKGYFTFWDESDDTGLVAAEQQAQEQMEAYRNAWLNLKLNWQEVMGTQGMSEWFTAGEMGMTKFKALAADAGVNVEKLATLTGSELAGAMDNASGKIQAYYNTQVAADQATTDLYNSLGTLNDKMATSAERATAAQTALAALNSSLTRGERESIDFAATLDETKSSLNKTNFALNKQGDALKHNNARLRAGAEWMLKASDAAIKNAGSQFATTDATRGHSAAIRQLSSRYKQNYDRLVENLVQTGKTRKEAVKMVNAYMRTPKQVKTTFTAENIDRLLEKGLTIDEILNKKLAGKKSVKVEAEGASKAEQDVMALQRRVEAFVRGDYNAGVTVTGAVDTSSDQFIFRKASGATVPLGSISAYAEGGPVRGMGGSNADQIPAWLSDGEFVIKAAAVRKYGLNFFNRLNEATKSSAKGFAQGGVVGRGSAAMSEREEKAMWRSIFERLFKSIDDKSTHKDDAKSEAKARKQANKEMEKILKQANRQLERSMKDMARDLVRAAKDALKEAQQAMADRIKDIASALQAFGSITMTGGTEYYSGQGLLEEKQARADLAAQFASQYEQLEGLGLNKKDLKAILEAGPQEGSAIATALLEGSGKEVKARIAEINALEAQIAQIGKDLGLEAAINEGYKEDVKEARAGVAAAESVQVDVHEGAVKVSIDLSGIDKDDRKKIENVVDRSINKALREFGRELRRAGR